MSIDPVDFVSSGGDPTYFNRFAYVGNDPINWTDPTGMCRGGDAAADCAFNTSISDQANAESVNDAKAIGDKALQEIDGAIQGLDNEGSYTVSAGNKSFTFTGSEIKNHWNNQSFTLTVNAGVRTTLTDDGEMIVRFPIFVEQYTGTRN